MPFGDWEPELASSLEVRGLGGGGHSPPGPISEEQLCQHPVPHPPQNGGGHPGHILKEYQPDGDPTMEHQHRREVANPCKMATATSTQPAEKPYILTKQDNLFAEFWEKIAFREQQAQMHKPVSHTPTEGPASSQCGRTHPPAARAQKWCRKRRGHMRGRKPARKTQPTALYHRNRYPVKSGLPSKQAAETFQTRYAGSRFGTPLHAGSRGARTAPTTHCSPSPPSGQPRPKGEP
ncbi:Hypothetical predicted protein [Pelobates cultripes]|uniref:Uncharacterized protein n=1 Tax=Pelobates cultripes TaxID=61616 RepID=A0AAD1SVH7_PELCU|nr:Hypothetical predicted protein [Pelobates cultripes]